MEEVHQGLGMCIKEEVHQWPTMQHASRAARCQAGKTPGEQTRGRAETRGERGEQDGGNHVLSKRATND